MFERECAERRNVAPQCKHALPGFEGRTVFRNGHAVPQVFASLSRDDLVTTGVGADVHTFIQAEVLDTLSNQPPSVCVCGNEENSRSLAAALVFRQRFDK